MKTLQQEHVELLSKIRDMERKAYKRLMLHPNSWVVRREGRENVEVYVWNGIRAHLRNNDLRYQSMTARLEIVMLLMRANAGSRLGEMNANNPITVTKEVHHG